MAEHSAAVVVVGVVIKCFVQKCEGGYSRSAEGDKREEWRKVYSVFDLTHILARPFVLRNKRSNTRCRR